MSVPGVHLLPLPTPFQIGAVNAYLLDGPPLTLIDCGPHTQEALDALCAHFDRLGYRLKDLKQLLITHPHMDHFGLAGAVRTQSGCRVVAHPGAVDKIADFKGHYAREQGFFFKFLVSMGMPEQNARLLTELPQSFSVLAPPAHVEKTLSEGMRLQVGDLGLEVLETPGHSPASLCFYDPEQRALFAGDHLIDGITPNPLLEMPPHPGAKRPRSLIQYLDSLEKVAPLALEVVFSGHRNLITDPQRVIDTSFEHQRKRSENVLKFLTQAPLTAYQLMEKLFPNLPATEQFLGMSEAVGHLEWLQAQGKVGLRSEQGVVYFEPL